MNKKTLSIVACACYLVLALQARAQQPTKIPRIGYLSSGDSARDSAGSEAIRLALRERGHIEGQNIASEYRYAEGKRDPLPELSAQLVRLKVDVIVTVGGARVIRAAMNATKTIPIVMVGQGSILLRQASWKALPVPAATSPALQTLAKN